MALLNRHTLTYHVDKVHPNDIQTNEDVLPGPVQPSVLVDVEKIYSQDQEPEYLCHICEKRFLAPGDLMNHIEIEHENETCFSCDHCGKILESENQLSTHLRLMHEQNITQELIPQYDGLDDDVSELSSVGSV